MPYALRIFAKAEKQLAKIAEPHQSRIIAKIRLLAGNPRPFGHLKLEGEEGLYRIRIGDYRVIYAIDDHSPAVIITKVAVRDKSYD